MLHQNVTSLVRIMYVTLYCLQLGTLPNTLLGITLLICTRQSHWIANINYNYSLCASGQVATTTGDPRILMNSEQLTTLTLIVVIVSVVVVIVMVVLLVGVCVTVRWVHKKKQEYYMNQTIIRANSLSMGAIKGYSPPVRTDSQSDYCSEMSGVLFQRGH